MEGELISTLIIIALLLLVSGFFSSSETALTAVSPARLYHMVVGGNKRAETVSRLRKDKDSLIGGILLGNNAVNTAAASIATSLAITMFGGSDLAIVVVTIVMTFLLVVFSEILPKTIAINHPLNTSLAFAPILSPIIALLSPITRTIQFVIRRLLRVVGVDLDNKKSLISATDVIRGMIELQHQEGHVIKQERDMLGSILDLGKVDVGDIMAHRTQVETLSLDSPTEELVSKILSSSHSRIPLWQEHSDNIVGVVHVKNLVKASNEYGSRLTNDIIKALCSDPWFIPETTPLDIQLLAFRKQRQHLAIVIDEYGALQGVVTLEDIMEEIVGEIDDEHDKVTKGIEKQADGSYIVAGNMTVRDVNRHLDWNLPDEEAATIAGLLIHEIQTIPKVTESFECLGYHFTVLQKKQTRLTKLRIAAMASSEADGD